MRNESQNDGTKSPQTPQTPHLGLAGGVHRRPAGARRGTPARRWHTDGYVGELVRFPDETVLRIGGIRGNRVTLEYIDPKVEPSTHAAAAIRFAGSSGGSHPKGGTTA